GGRAARDHGPRAARDRLRPVRGRRPPDAAHRPGRGRERGLPVLARPRRRPRGARAAEPRPDRPRGARRRGRRRDRARALGARPRRGRVRGPPARDRERQRDAYALPVRTGSIAPAGASLAASFRSGSSIRNVAPPPGRDSTETLPACASATAATIARPRPTPPLWRERDGSAR